MINMIDIDETVFLKEAKPLFLAKFTLRTIEVDRIKTIFNSQPVINMIEKLNKKQFILVNNYEQLTDIQKVVISNKIEEIREKYISKGVGIKFSADVGVNVLGIKPNVGGGADGDRTVTKKSIRNILLTNIDEHLCIVEANDKGRIMNVNLIFSKRSTELKFVNVQKSVFKF